MRKRTSAILIVIPLLILACNSATPQPRSQAPAPVANPGQPTAQHDHVKTARVPDYYETEPSLDLLAPTLDPEMFSGNKRLAYQVAKEIPQTLAQLPCYCHCDMSIGHKSLQSCFVTEHGENCGICIGEALMAYQLQKREKLPIAEIRKRIIAAYRTNAASD